MQVCIKYANNKNKRYKKEKSKLSIKYIIYARVNT